MWQTVSNLRRAIARKFKQVKGITMSLYWQSMQLTYDPFMAEQANQTPFVSPKWEQQLNLLVHLATSQDSMLLVLGVSGIGKSTMMRQFIETLGHAGGICKIHGGATITTDVLQDLVARHLGFAVSQVDPEQFSSKLLEQMGRMRGEGHDFYLVIDNAHKLPKASLAFLLELVEIQGADHHPIHIVLFGGPQLEAMIGDITSQHLGEVLTHSIQLEPLSLEYVKNYVEQRLSLAGFTEGIPFTQNQLQQIYQISGGIPAKVNSLARQLLLQWSQQGHKKSNDRRFASSQQGHQKKAKPLSIYWFAGAAIAVVVVVLLIMTYFNSPNANTAANNVANQTLMISSSKDNTQDYDEAGNESGPSATQIAAHPQANTTAVASTVPDSSYTEIDSSNTTSPNASTAAVASTAQDQVVNSDTNVNAGNADSVSSGNDEDTSANGDNTDQSSTSQTVNQALAANAALTKPVASASAAQAIALTSQAKMKPMTNSEATTPTAAISVNPSLVSAASNAKAPESSPADAEYIPANGQIPMDDAVLAPNSTARVQAKAPTTSAKVSANTKPIHVSPTPKVNVATKTKPTSTKASADVKPEKPKTAPAVKAKGLDVAYFTAQPGSHVALQIAAARDVTKLKQQVTSYGLSSQVRYFKTTMKGGPWYVAVYGNYPTMAAATSAKSHLPSVVLATKPWPRSFQSIQTAINVG